MSADRTIFMPKPFTAVYFRVSRTESAHRNICCKVWYPRLMDGNLHWISYCVYRWKWLTCSVCRLNNCSRSSRERVSKNSSAKACLRSFKLSSRPSTQSLSKTTSFLSATTNRVLSPGSSFSLVTLSNFLHHCLVEAWKTCHSKRAHSLMSWMRR